MGTEDVKDRYIAIRETVISDLFSEYISPQELEEDWDVEGLHSVLKTEYATDVPIQKSIEEGLDVDEILKVVLQSLTLSHDIKEQAVGSETMRTFEKAVMLRALDHHWKEHLALMDHLRQSVNLRGYAQKNPVQEYKRESFTMFTLLLETINVEMVKALCSVSIEQKQSPEDESTPAEITQKAQPSKQQTKPASRPNVVQQPKRAKKIGRNEPCPCGSGKKYKHCHG
jgi:preprotein translocase subunit SecA